jgi:hypothetical protein
MYVDGHMIDVSAGHSQLRCCAMLGTIWKSCKISMGIADCDGEMAEDRQVSHAGACLSWFLTAG